MNNKAFTLIELLIAVLIIGILAAIAVPQYQKAVKKMRYVKGITYIRNLTDALERYRLEHGAYPTSYFGGLRGDNPLNDILDINMPPIKTPFYLYYNGMYVGYYDSNQRLWIIHWWDGPLNNIKCFTEDTKAENISLCKLICRNAPDYSGKGAYGCNI